MLEGEQQVAQLNGQVIDLYENGRYDDALPAATVALRLARASSTRGTRSWASR